MNKGAGAIAQAAIVAASFSLLFIGTNAVNPLLPVYRDLLGLDALLLSLTFVCYVIPLVAVLLLFANPRFTRHAVPLLLVGLVVAIGSDLLLAHAEEWSILLGRGVAGVAGGLGTGAAAALVVAAIGAPGRALAATGNLVGAVIGTAGSQLIVSSLPAAAPQLVTLGHAALVTVVLVAGAVVLVARRRANREALAATSSGTARLRLDGSAARILVTGCIVWVGLSIAIVFGATLFADLDQPVVRAVGPALMLGTSAAAQLASPVLARIAPWMSGLVASALGAAGVVLGAVAASAPLALVGFAVLGAGLGVAARTGLVALTRGAEPARQGALSSLFSAVTYGAAAVTMPLFGGIGNSIGLAPIALGGLAVIAVLCLVALLWAPRLRDTLDQGHTA